MTVAFGHRQQVGHNLAGMLHIRQGVDDRHTAVLRQLHQRLVPIDPRYNAVHIAAEYPRHIGHRLPPAQAHFVGRQVNAEPAQFLNAHCKG